ncbi:flavodoxin [Xylanibacter rodentium]|uniref:flavodoxin n=1 Tax=Xylanibacter rodentium TaxID=2736289 RepID=UPI002599DA8A|nr:flavodoxin [Xylanibacter rodentium]
MGKIKTFLIVVMAVISANTIAYAQNNKMQKKVLITYFSATGTTAQAAKRIANVTGGDLYAITPVESYTGADLDWQDKQSRSSVEMNDPKSRPAIKGTKENIADYDVIFIGYPIWWDLAPRVINTFIESHDLKGKIVIPFATSGGSTLAGSATALKKSYPSLNWKEGRLLNRADEKTIRTWIEKLGF